MSKTKESEIFSFLYFPKRILSPVINPICLHALNNTMDQYI